MILTEKNKKNFWKKVNKTNCCWEWTAYKNKGYGQFAIDGNGQQAHRISFLIHNGYLPEYVLHKCSLFRPDGLDNPGCVNPDHLYEGTQGQNMQDALRVGTRPSKKYPNYVKLTNKITVRGRVIKAIKEEYVERYGERARLARKYNLPHYLISRILNEDT